MAYIGETCIRSGRLKGSYMDRTANLRSSVGYVLVEDGKIITMSGFEQLPGNRRPGKGEKRNGGKQGREFAMDTARKFPEGLVLILVAGMKYAARVADSGKDVLDSAEREAELLMGQLTNQVE
jgi:hypothetical protein